MNTRLFVLVPAAILAAAAVAQPQLTPLASAPHTNSYATAISTDGSFVAGFFDPGPDAFIWSATSGMTTIPGAAGAWTTVPYAVSPTGAVAGESRFVSIHHAFRWTADTGLQNLPSLVPGASAYAWAMSDDGQVVVGSAETGTGLHAFRWTSASGMVDLNIPESTALAISADAGAIAGSYKPTPSTVGSSLFRWTQAAGLEDLGTLGANDTDPFFINPDASIIVGTTYDTETFNAFRWTQANGMQVLDLPDPAVSASAVDASDDASLIVGYWIDYDYEAHAAIWTADGAFDLLAYLQSLNTLAINGWTFRNATGVSGDGSTIVGTGTHNGVDAGFIITGLPHGASCPPCAADYDQDGGVTGGDIGAFIADWEAGTSCADVDLDGGITGADLAAFFSVFEAGGC